MSATSKINLGHMPGAEFSTSGSSIVGSSATLSGPSSLNSTPPGMPSTSTGSSISSIDIVVVAAIIGLVIFLWWKSRKG